MSTRRFGGYSYLPFAEVTKDVGFDGGLGNQGKRFFQAPRHAGSFWNTYEVLGGDLRGLKLGAGVVAVGEQEGDPANTYQLPGYATVNLLANYQWNLGPTKLTAQLNVDNLLDKTYFVGTNTAMALSADTQPHFSTLAGFISSMSEEIPVLFRDVLLYCDEVGWIGKELFGIDGCKMPSNASKDGVGPEPILRRRNRRWKVPYGICSTGIENGITARRLSRWLSGKQLKTLREKVRKVRLQRHKAGGMPLKRRI